MRNTRFITTLAVLAVAGALFIAGIAVWAGCGGSSPSSPSALDGSGKAVYPMFTDGNGNGINDFVESFAHDPGSPALSHVAAGRAGGGHRFTDRNRDRICDYAQNASNTWHGPGFVDNDGDGICDYWDEDSPLFNSHDGQRFLYRHTETNQVRNAYTEMPYHGNDCGHPFVDNDGDGICDHAEDGSCSWHGPGFVDSDGDGICDHYGENGGGRPRYRYENTHQNRNEEHIGAGPDADIGPTTGSDTAPGPGSGPGPGTGGKS